MLSDLLKVSQKLSLFHSFKWPCLHLGSTGESASGVQILDTTKRVILQKRQNVEKVRVHLLVGKLFRKSPRDEENEDVHSPPQATEKLPKKRTRNLKKF